MKDDYLSQENDNKIKENVNVNVNIKEEVNSIII